MSEGTTKKKKFLPINKAKLKSYKEQRQNSLNAAMETTVIEETTTTAQDGVTKKTIDLPKKFKKEQSKTGVLDTKKFSIFGEVMADKKKVVKAKNDGDDDLGADLKHWISGKTLKKTEQESAPSPAPQKTPPPAYDMSKLKRTATPDLNNSNVQDDLDADLGVEMTDDDFRDDNDDQAERELAAVFANDQAADEVENDFDLKNSTPSSLVNKHKNKLLAAASPLEERKPPSRSSNTPGTLAAEKLKKFGDYSLLERSNSKASEQDDTGENLPTTVNVSDMEEPARSQTPVDRVKTGTPADGGRGTPGKLQFKMQQKVKEKKAIKTGTLDIKKLSKFGDGSVSKRPEGGDGSAGSPAIPRKRNVGKLKLDQFNRTHSPMPVDDDDVSVERVMRRQRKLSDDEMFDPFEGVPERTSTPQPMEDEELVNEELAGEDVEQEEMEQQDVISIEANEVNEEYAQAESDELIPEEEGVPSAEEVDMKTNEKNKEDKEYDPTSYNVHRIAKLPSPDVIKQRKRMAIRQPSADDYLNEMIGGLKENKSPAHVKKTKPSSSMDIEFAQKRQRPANDFDYDRKARNLEDLEHERRDMERRQRRLLEKSDDDVNRSTPRDTSRDYEYESREPRTFDPSIDTYDHHHRDYQPRDLSKYDSSEYRGRDYNMDYESSRDRKTFDDSLNLSRSSYHGDDEEYKSRRPREFDDSIELPRSKYNVGELEHEMRDYDGSYKPRNFDDSVSKPRRDADDDFIRTPRDLKDGDVGRERRDRSEIDGDAYQSGKGRDFNDSISIPRSNLPEAEDDNRETKLRDHKRKSGANVYDVDPRGKARDFDDSLEKPRSNYVNEDLERTSKEFDLNGAARNADFNAVDVEQRGKAKDFDGSLQIPRSSSTDLADLESRQRTTSNKTTQPYLVDEVEQIGKARAFDDSIVIPKSNYVEEEIVTDYQTKVGAEDEEEDYRSARRFSKDQEIVETEEMRQRRLAAQFEEMEKQRRREMRKELEELKRKEQEEKEREEAEANERKRSISFSDDVQVHEAEPSKRKIIEQELKEQEQKFLERQQKLEEAERLRKLDEEIMRREMEKRTAGERQSEEEKKRREKERRKVFELQQQQEYEEKIRRDRERRLSEQREIEEMKKRQRDERRRSREEKREQERLAWEAEVKKRQEEEERMFEERRKQRQQRTSQEKIENQELLKLQRLKEEQDLRRLEEIRLERERKEHERQREYEILREEDMLMMKRLKEQERLLQEAEEQYQRQQRELKEEAERQWQAFRRHEIERQREVDERRLQRRGERKEKKALQIQHEDEEMDRLWELERQRADDRRRKKFEEEERLRNLELERLRLEAEKRRKELEAIAAEMRKIEELRRLRAEQRRIEEEERRRREEEERLRREEEERRRREEEERLRKEREEAERLLRLQMEEQRRREEEERRRKEEEERLRREAELERLRLLEEERLRRLEWERMSAEEKRRRELEEAERRRREEMERALRMMEKNNFDGWSLLAVGEEAVIEPPKDGGEMNIEDVENEINLVEVEEEQVQRTREKWVLVARGKEKEKYQDEWISLAQGSEMADDNFCHASKKLKAWAREQRVSVSSMESSISNQSEEREAWDRRMLPIQIDEFISIQEKHQFTFVDRKGRMKVLKKHVYNNQNGHVSNMVNDDELHKKHSMFFVENAMRNLQDYQLRMRGLLMKMY